LDKSAADSWQTPCNVRLLSMRAPSGSRERNAAQQGLDLESLFDLPTLIFRSLPKKEAMTNKSRQVKHTVDLPGNHRPDFPADLAKENIDLMVQLPSWHI
jgi:hypothetical protein